MEDGSGREKRCHQDQLRSRTVEDDPPEDNAPETSEVASDDIIPVSSLPLTEEVETTAAEVQPVYDQSHAPQPSNSTFR